MKKYKKQVRWWSSGEGFAFPLKGAWFQFLTGELRAPMPSDTVKYLSIYLSNLPLILYKYKKAISGANKCKFISR